MDQKKKIGRALVEMSNQKNVVMSSDKYKEMEDDLDDDTIVKIVDETLSMGRKDIPAEKPKKGKLPMGRKDIPAEKPKKGKLPMGRKNIGETETTDVPKLQADVQRFMDKLNLGQFEAVIKKIDKPVEKAELIAAFAERIGVPRVKLTSVLSSLKELGKQSNGEGVKLENTRPRMTKSAMVEHILKNKK